MKNISHGVGYELWFINEHEKAYTMVDVEHGFTRMARIGTDKKSVDIRRIRVICVLCGFYTFSYQAENMEIF